MNGALFARLWKKRVSGYAWAVLLALLVLPFGLRPSSAATPPHIAVIAMENHGYTTIVGNSGMPFTQSLISGNGIASITDTCHPSLPNYLSITDGSIHGCPQDTAPSDATYSGPTLYDELANAGISWKGYIQDQSIVCDKDSGFSNFDVNHAPQYYYNSVRNTAAQCNRMVPYTQLATDLTAGTAPSLIWITPNLINDMHDGTDQQGDAYLNSQVTQLRNSSWFTPGSRILVWWDEDEGTSNEQILLISVGSNHSVTIGPASHYGVLRGLEEAYGVGLLGHSADSSVPAEGGTVGDILPLLTGAAPPPPPPPSPSPTPTPTPTPTPSPSATPSPTPPPPSQGPSSGTRGIVRFTSTDWSAMHSAGFNAATDGGVQDNGGAEAAAGLTGMVWVDAYNNTTCTQTMTNATIQALVQANVSAGHPGLRYMVGDEPTANGCVAAPAYTSMTQAVHAVDPTAKTWTFDDQFQVGNPVLPNIPMAGSVDILAFDVYPCQSGPCDYSAIDSAVQQIHAAGLTNWEFGIQDFSASPWRWPTPAEIQEQFAHWQNSGAIGYWVFAWDYLGGSVTTQSGNVAALQAINALPINGSGSPSPTPTPTPTPSASPTSSPTPSPTPTPAPTPSPSPSPTPAPALTASASANTTSGTAPLTVGFTGSASGGVGPYTYAWNFGDGSSSSAQSPSHTFSGAGSFTPALIVTDSHGTQAMASTATIIVRSTLVASAAGTPTFGDVPVTVNFTGSASGGAGSFSYAWSFGDSATSTSQNPTHTYTVAGNFTATLTVTDAAGATGKSSVTVSAGADPSLVITANPSIGDAPATIAFNPTIAGGTSPFTYTWAFGDGGTSTASSPSHTYAAAGIYTAQLTVLDVTGHMANAGVAVTVNPAPQATASANITNGDAPQTVSFTGGATSGTPTFTYAWSFGDGATSHGVQSPSHVYAVAGTYTATFTATDAAGGSASASVVITVNAPPLASVQASTLAGSAPLPVTFTGSASSGIGPYSYSWSFGDGGTSAIKNPSHTYAAAGSFTVTLTVTDAVGKTAVANAGPITVSGPLAALAGAVPQPGDAPVTVAFFGSAAGGTAPYTYIWNLGDGSSSSSQNPTHVYAAAGTYTATLTVTDDRQNSAIAHATVQVAPALTAGSSASPSSGTAPLPVNFTGTQSGGKAPYTFTWTFGDGASSSAQSPQHTYSLPGTFTATLTVGDANGATATATALTVNVAPGPLVATAASTVSTGDAPLPATISAAVTGGVAPYSFAWNLGDGSTVTTGSVNHTYSAAGSYTAAVVVTDSRGVQAQSSVQVTVYPSLSVSSSATPTSGRAPLQVAFSASASGGLQPYTFSWAFDDGTSGAGPSATHTFGGGVFHPRLTVHDGVGGSWTGIVADVTSTALALAAPAQTSGGGSSSGSSGTAAPPADSSSPAASPTTAAPPADSSSPAASPTTAAPLPTANPTPSSDSQPGANTNASDSNGNNSAGNAGLVMTLLGSVMVTGLGGTVFLWWRRRRLL